MSGIRDLPIRIVRVSYSFINHPLSCGRAALFSLEVGKILMFQLCSWVTWIICHDRHVCVLRLMEQSFSPPPPVHPFCMFKGTLWYQYDYISIWIFYIAPWEVSKIMFKLKCFQNSLRVHLSISQIFKISLNDSNDCRIYCKCNLSRFPKFFSLAIDVKHLVRF